ncbi:unnamed protein product [Protopolystoma xenopodis]|uniref:Uncharacterized protein n=1 Tax=Protopolystoma xenopodis TaxID=117903 RepID=A0A448XDG6_9PLAT|nr:unnamed protein product [Protopolystoma xenopodis]
MGFVRIVGSTSPRTGVSWRLAASGRSVLSATRRYTTGQREARGHEDYFPFWRNTNTSCLPTSDAWVWRDRSPDGSRRQTAPSLSRADVQTQA